MPDKENLRVNYYVGSVLAQGGEVRLEGGKIIFSPTSSIDRAMGAKEVEIPFQKIRGVEHKGEFLRTFTIKTEEKTHKFEGSQARKLAELLEKELKNQGLIANIPFEKTTDNLNLKVKPQAPTEKPCIQCKKSLKPEFFFCPFCGIKKQ
jgi:hypothetical protein